jgi:hypothetical protein
VLEGEQLRRRVATQAVCCRSVHVLGAWLAGPAPQRYHLQVEPEAPFPGNRGHAELALDLHRLVLPQHAGLVQVAVDVEVDVGALEALVAVHVEQHVGEARFLEQPEELAVRAKAVVEHHGDVRRRSARIARLARR